ncbi:MAG: F510_1955 family glycosylhydrolase [Dehalococcoidia bacterium]
MQRSVVPRALTPVHLLARCRPRVLPVILLAAAIITVACTSSAPTNPTGRQTGAADPGVVHVHGLGVNPKDGALYAATHTGLFRIPDQGRAERIGDRYQDTMGFTVVGPDHFLGSGHPDMRDYQAKRLPSLLGLIESTDAGTTWQPISLLGDADFHALKAAHGRVYGFNSSGNTFMVSGDGKAWETRAKVLMRDFAVSPADAELIVAAMAQDVQRSRDGGRTWERLHAPPLVVLAWRDADALWGLTATGALFQSTDAGATWQQHGAVAGQPDAFLAADEVLYVSVYQDGIYMSEDGGKSWRLRYRESA